MKKKNTINIIILICLICGSDIFSFSQQNKIDSLKNVLLTVKEDTIRIQILNDLDWILLNNGDYEQATLYANDVLELTTHFTGENAQTAIGLAMKKGKAGAYGHLGAIQQLKGNYSEALKNYFACMKINEELGNKRLIAISYNNIGLVYKELGNYTDALKNHLICLKMMEEIGNKKGISMSYNNLGIIYRIQNNYPEALKSYFAALKIGEEMKDKNRIAMSYNNIGEVYKRQGNYADAIKNYSACLKIMEESGNKEGVAVSHLNTGEANILLKNFPQSRKELDYAFSLFKEIGHKEGMKNSYSDLSQLDSVLGNWKGAYEYHKLYSEIKDSIFNEESSKQIAEMQTKYDTEKKELQIENLHKDNAIKETEIKKQNIQKIAFASGFGLMLILAFVIFRGYNQKKKANEIISAQKTEVEKQKEIVDVKNKSLEVAYKHIEEKNTEILDSIRYAKRIQEAILPPQKLVKQHLEQSFILYKPKDIVAGDFYWMHSSQGSVVRSSETQKTPNSELVSELPTPNSQLILFAVVDCTGHGVPGAFMSILGFNGLNRCVKEFGLTEPAKILDKLCELVDEAFSKSEADIKDGMDIALCSLEFGVGSSETGHPASGGMSQPLRQPTTNYQLPTKLQYSGAGNSLYLIRKTPLPNGEGQGVGLTEYKADKQPIGKFSNRKPFVNHEIQLQKGDSVYVFTDGYADKFGGPKGKKFKYSQFEKLLISIQEKPMTEQREILNKSIDEWRGELEQIDDICVIGVRV